jgi:hypothetical protein
LFAGGFLIVLNKLKWFIVLELSLLQSLRTQQLYQPELVTVAQPPNLGKMAIAGFELQNHLTNYF